MSPIAPPSAILTVDQQVDALLARMTLEEKVGQMTQVVLEIVCNGESETDGTPQLDPAKLREAVIDQHVGSLLNVVTHGYTVETWRSIITEIQRVAAESRLQIPVIFGIDAVHGVNYTLGATLFPQNIALGATFRPALVEKAAAITAAQTRASAIPWNFSPVLDLGRQPLWPRFYETFSEDVLVTRQMGVAATVGTQGDPADLTHPAKVAGCLKHYIGYSVPYSGKDRTTALIPDHLLRELFLPPYRDAVAAGARTVMINSGDINGQPVHCSRYLLTEVLRDELGFDGVIVTDWEDIKKLHDVHCVAPTQREAVRMAVEAGIDMSMVPYDYSFAEHLLSLVQEGAISEARVDESVQRILRLKFELGLFDDPLLEAAWATPIGGDAADAVNRDAAREAMTLLKNEGDLLPLAPEAKILVTGPGADSILALNGGWTYTWQGQDDAYLPYYPDAQSILAAIRDHAARVTHVPGVSFSGEGDIDAAVAAAQEADVAVVVLGESAYAEKQGDLDDLALPAEQIQLAQAIAATGTPVVLVLLEGRPRVVTEAAHVSQAILMAYQPGMEGGKAVAEVLFGVVNPSGKLPCTYPLGSNDLITYDHTHTAGQGQVFGGIGQVRGYAPLFEFGHGLSYTTFAYSDLELAADVIGPKDAVRISVIVTNTGERTGAETVLVYVRDCFASVTPPVKRLRAFDKITLEPGESRRLTITIPTSELAFVGHNSQWILEPGDFEVQIAELSASFRLEA